MADYHSPTVIAPDVPIADMTPLEKCLLTHMFDFDVAGDAVYFFAELSIELRPFIELKALRQAYAESHGVPSQCLEPIGKLIDRLAVVDDTETVDVDLVDEFEDLPYLRILQDIIRRSKEVNWFTVTTAYTCTVMRVDGFGGRATLVCADRMFSQSTDAFLESCFEDAKLEGH